MTSKQQEFASMESSRAELETVLRSELFRRAPTLASLLSYLCEKTFAGQDGQIKEFSVAVDVFGRGPSFDQDADSIVRVQANRLRKRLAEYYAGEGADHRVQITIPVGQYVPFFGQKEAPVEAPAEEVPAAGVNPSAPASTPTTATPFLRRRWLLLAGAAGLVALVAVFAFTAKSWRGAAQKPPADSSTAIASTPAIQPMEGNAGGMSGKEIRILAGSTRTYVDRAGKLWTADSYYSGGSGVSSAAQYIGRTLDPEIYRNSRQGEFQYDIPLQPGIYELRLHFAETLYGPEGQAGGGEGSRIMAIRANGQPLLSGFDVVADAGGSNTADVKVFTDITPAADGKLHLSFMSIHGGRGMVSAIEILPGAAHRMHPVRMVARDSAYYSNDSRWWGPDNYFRGGQLAVHRNPVAGSDDAELFEGERWGHFSYAIPVAPGKYDVTLLFAERRFGPGNRDRNDGPPREAGDGRGARVFNVFCNGKVALRELDIFKEAGENRPLVRKISGVAPDAQGKLMLEFVPVKDYATLTAIEVVPQ